MIAETITSALTTAEIWKNQPIAFPTLIKNIGMMLYMVAQFKFKPERSDDPAEELDNRDELSAALAAV
jgi:hypothetical protein